MPNGYKITHEEAELKSKNKGFKLLEQYYRITDKYKFQCLKCHNIYIHIARKIFEKRLKYCKICHKEEKRKLYSFSQDEAQIKCNNLGFKLIGEYINAHTKTFFICPICNKKFLTEPNNIFKQSLKSCGHCNDPKIEDKFGRLTVIEVYTSNNGGCRVKCQCDCGNFWQGFAAPLYRGRTRSCGCLQREITSKRSRKNISNQKFGKLIAIKSVYTNKNGQRIWKCHCKCGNVIYCSTNKLISQHTKSCGNCNMYQYKRNGQTTSLLALKLDMLIQSLNYNTIHNDIIYKNKQSKITVDITIPEHKIAIEYDEWYWHGHRQKEDKARLRTIRKLGWKTLQIKSIKNLPTTIQLQYAIQYLINNHQQKTITLKRWGQGPTRFPIKDSK